MNEHIITKREKCPTCSGNGYIEHPEWIDWYKNARYTDPYLYFSEIGYDKPPLVEIECQDCNGDGYVTSDVDLDIAFREFCQIYQLPIDDQL